MITGTVMFDVEVSVKDEAQLAKLSNYICTAVRSITGVVGVSVVDSDIEYSDDTDDDE